MQVTTQDVEKAVTANNLFAWRGFTIEDAMNAVPDQPLRDALMYEKCRTEVEGSYGESEDDHYFGVKE